MTYVRNVVAGGGGCVGGGGHPRPCVDGARSTTGRAGSRVASGKSPAIGALMQCGKRARALPCKWDVGFIFFWDSVSILFEKD